MAARGATYEELAGAFRQRKFAPVYLLYGEERFFVDRLQSLLLERALAPHERDFNLDIVYGRDTDIQSVLALCSAYPMMAERRVVVVRDFDEIADNKRFKEYVERPNPAAVVLLLAGEKVNLAHHPYRAIREHAVAAEFKRLYEREIPRWVDAEVRDRGFTIDPGAVSMLSEYVGTSLLNAVQEIDKLTAFVGDRTHIDKDDVVQASGQTREFNVFELQKAVGDGRYPDAMRIAERMLQQASNSRGEALMIVSVLTSYYTKLWVLTACHARRISEKEMAARLGIPPFFVGDYLSSLRRLDRSSLSSAFSALASADYELKGGSGRDERLTMSLLVRRLTWRAAALAA